ncbi:MAG: hypothetical protein A2Z95_04185 [Gallionellales bacterium GWA2_60_18]|nr:MAG: hypothetical protein A2Z95_04185 [Gallionellales bacterium GWA2_60_18]
MSRSLLLLLSADHLHAQLMVNSKISTQREFSDSAEDQRAFADFLQEVKYPVYLLVDLVEEDFRQESIPHLFGRSRSAMLKRKFEQYYRNTPFCEAALLQRQKTGRRDDDMLFSALTNPTLIMPWLEIMQAQQTPLAGIYSVPQISAPLIKDHPSRHLLLISWEKYAGLRQTYFSDHRLQISRLTPIHGDISFTDTVVRELTRTYQYLKSLSLLPAGQTLDVLILCHADDHARLQDGRLPDSADMRYSFIELADIARQLKIDYHFADSDSRQVFLHQLAAKPPKVNYADTPHLHYYSLWQLRHRLAWLSAILLLGSMLLSAATIWQGSLDADEADSIQSQAQRTLAEAEQITRAFPNTYASASDMKAGVTTMRRIAQLSHLPGETLLPISAALDSHPQLELDELSWQTDPDTATGSADAHFHIVTIKGRLTGFASDYRAALNYLDDLQRGLTAQGYLVTILSKPLDVSPGSNIADQREMREDGLGFSLKLSQRHAT